MKNNVEKRRISKSTIILGIIVLCYFLSGLFTLGTFNKPTNYYYAEQKNEVQKIEVLVKLDYKDDQTVNQIWMNTGIVEVSEGSNATITFKYANSTSSSGITLRTANIGGVGSETANLFNWTQLYKDITNISTSYSYFRLTFNNDMQINELVFLDKDGEKISASIADGDESAAYLFDEQDTFTTSVNFKNTVTQSESYTLSAAVNLIKTRGYIVDGDANALGVQIIALGVLIFGVNTIGLRIMPLLFSTAIIILLYFLGKKLFKKDWLAIVMSLLFVLSGYAFSVGRSGSVIPIAAFFILMSLMFMYEFYSQAILKKADRNIIITLFVSGVFFTLALAVSSIALFALIALLIIFVIAVVKQYYKYSAKIKEHDADNTETKKYKAKRSYKFKLDILLFVASFILMPVLILTLLYIISYSSLNLAYTESGFFSVMIKDITSFFTFQKTTSIDNTSSFISWLFNYRTSVLFADTAYAGKEAFAVIFNSVAALLSIFAFAAITLFMIVFGLSHRVSRTSYNYYTSNIKQFVFMLIGLICFVVPFALIKNQMNTYFYLGSIFYTGFICLYLNKMDMESEGEKIFVNMDGGIQKSKFAAIVICSLIAINFLMVLPLYFGIPVSLKYSSALYWITNIKPSSFIK